MRYLLTILFLNSTAFAQTNRYVSNSGNDANTGTLASPYATIYKALSVAVSGDSILLNSGSTFQGNYTITTSNLKFNSYGSGANPIVTVLQSQSGFTNTSGNIWSATADSAVAGLNLVILNRSIAHKARFPNVGWLTFTGYSGDSSITTSLSAGHTNFGIAVRTVPWVIDVTKIKLQTGGTLSLFSKLTYPPAYGGNGYFLQGDVSLLDTTGEYSYNDTTKLLSVYSTSTPTVQIATRDTLINLNKLSSISFNNIQFSGGNKELIYSDSSTNITVNSSNLFYSGGNAFNGATLVSQFNNDSIQNILNNGVVIYNGYNFGDSNKVINSHIRKVGFLAGMAQSGQNSNGLIIWGNHSLVQYDTFDSIGYDAINFNGKFARIFNNFFNNYAFVTSDGGAIYTAIGVDSIQLANLSDSGSEVKGNIIQNGIGANAGTTNNAGAVGVYLDENISHVLVDSNSIYNTYGEGVLFHDVNNNTATNNNIYGVNGSSFSFPGSHNNTFKHNQMFANSGQYVTYMQANDVTESVDSNYLSRWTTEGTFMYNQGSNQTLTTWAGATSYDTHSHPTPVDITYDPVLYYSNPTLSSITINLGQTYKDFFNNSANSFTIAPYRSLILFRALNQIIPPVPPGQTTISNLKVNIKSK